MVEGGASPSAVDTPPGASWSQRMEVQLSVEQEAKLSRMSDQTGKSVEELAREAVDRCLSEEVRFHAGVKAGQESAARGDFVPASEVWAKVERALKA